MEFPEPHLCSLPIPLYVCSPSSVDKHTEGCIVQLIGPANLSTVSCINNLMEGVLDS